MFKPKRSIEKNNVSDWRISRQSPHLLGRTMTMRDHVRKQVRPKWRCKATTAAQLIMVFRRHLRPIKDPRQNAHHSIHSLKALHYPKVRRNLTQHLALSSFQNNLNPPSHSQTTIPHLLESETFTPSPVHPLRRLENGNSRLHHPILRIPILLHQHGTHARMSALHSSYVAKPGKRLAHIGLQQLNAAAQYHTYNYVRETPFPTVTRILSASALMELPQIHARAAVSTLSEYASLRRCTHS